MGVTKVILKPGNKSCSPRKGDTVFVEYTGYLYDPVQADRHYMGTRFDTSKGRGPLKTQIGLGRVVEGWDQGILGMCLGEKAILTITSDYGYKEQYVARLLRNTHILSECLFYEHAFFNDNSKYTEHLTDISISYRGFPGLIPPNTDLVFEVELIGINDKKP